jgi:pilus assembly protein Flp/PilA
MLFLASERGQGLVEYAFIIMLVAVVVVVVLGLVGQELLQLYTKIGVCLPDPDLVQCLSS